MAASKISNSLSQQYLEPLLTGDREICRLVIDQALSKGVSEYELLTKLIWPTMELIQTLYREDRISQSTLNLATRLNRTITDQLAAKLPRSASNGRKVLIFCGNDEPEELGGQLCSDLFESAGWNVRFCGGGVPNDEILKLIGEHRPDLLVMYGTLPSGVPNVRKLIDYLREVNSCPEMQIMCCGGIYKRAEGLAEEIGRTCSPPTRRARWASRRTTRRRRRRSTSRRWVAAGGSARQARKAGTMPPPRRKCRRGTWPEKSRARLLSFLMVPGI